MTRWNHLADAEAKSSFSHLRSRMIQDTPPPEAGFEKLVSLRKRALLSRTAAVLREIVEKMSKN